jgi:hypothetical protein
MNIDEIKRPSEPNYDYMVECQNIEDFNTTETFIKDTIVANGAICERWCEPMTITGTTAIYVEVPAPNRLVYFQGVMENAPLFEVFINKQISLDVFKTEIANTNISNELKNIIQKLQIVDRNQLIKFQ